MMRLIKKDAGRRSSSLEEEAKVVEAKQILCNLIGVGFEFFGGERGIIYGRETHRIGRETEVMPDNRCSKASLEYWEASCMSGEFKLWDIV